MERDYKYYYYNRLEELRWKLWNLGVILFSLLLLKTVVSSMLLVDAMLMVVLTLINFITFVCVKSKFYHLSIAYGVLTKQGIAVIW